MKKYLGFALIVVVTVLLMSGCQKAHEYVGRFTDEFNNVFELRADHSVTIHFAGSDHLVETVWRDSVYHKIPFAAIEFNGDPAYYYLRDGSLYRRLDNMEDETCAINIHYEEE